MKRVTIYMIPILLFMLTLSANEHLQKILENRIQKNDKRYSSFILCLELLEKANAKVLVETGTARNGDLNFWGDGGSTIIFGDFAKQNDAILYSVDIANSAIKNAEQATKEYEDHIQFNCLDSIEFLKNFNLAIDFLYLDSFDFDENNPKPSQEHHLKEIVTAYPLLHNKSIVMVDDCDLPFGGKGVLVIDFLLSKNWKIIHQGYQVILIPDL